MLYDLQVAHDNISGEPFYALENTKEYGPTYCNSASPEILLVSQSTKH